MIEKLSEGMYYSESYFSEEVDEVIQYTTEFEEKIERWDDEDQYQLYQEALNWIEYSFDEIKGMCFKTEQLSMQQGIRQYGEKGKAAVMKEIKGLAIKNDCFGELNYESMSEEEKKRVLPLLMFLTAKRNGDIKSRGVINGSAQKVYTNKDECA